MESFGKASDNKTAVSVVLNDQGKSQLVFQHTTAGVRDPGVGDLSTLCPEEFERVDAKLIDQMKARAKSNTCMLYILSLRSNSFSESQQAEFNKVRLR